jgi:hypothetical protein
MAHTNLLQHAARLLGETVEVATPNAEVRGRLDRADEEGIYLTFSGASEPFFVPWFQVNGVTQVTE